MLSCNCQYCILISMKKKIALLILFWLFIVGVYQSNKALPNYVNYAGEEFRVKGEDVKFLQDLTYLNSKGERVSEQQIFPEVFKMIDEAEEYILLDLFLYNDFLGTETSSYRPLSGELTEKLIQKKQDKPEIIIQLITDPINTLYGGYVSDNFVALEDAGIKIITTDLKKLRDSNPVYSVWWRTFFQWFGNSSDGGYLPNPMEVDSAKLTFRTYLSLLNYKANHRKVVMTDYCKKQACGFSSLITSANPHDGSSAHSNVAIKVDTFLWKDILKSEEAVVGFSGRDFIYPKTEFINKVTDNNAGSLQIQLLTEGAIKDRILKEINNLQANDSIDMAMFYLSDRDVIKALKKADDREVKIRLIFDPNKDAFGREKKGVPNRQVAHELMKASTGNTKIRWCDTHGEQCHSKLLLLKSKNGTVLVQGSANFTKRNISDYNLETDLVITGSSGEQVFLDASNFFEKQWSNEDENIYTAEYEKYQDTSLYRTVNYRFKEFSGISRW